MKFVSALFFLLHLLALPTAAGETAPAKNEWDRAYSDVTELFESLRAGNMGHTSDKAKEMCGL